MVVATVNVQQNNISEPKTTDSLCLERELQTSGNLDAEHSGILCNNIATSLEVVNLKKFF